MAWDNYVHALCSKLEYQVHHWIGEVFENLKFGKDKFQIIASQLSIMQQLAVIIFNSVGSQEVKEDGVYRKWLKWK